MSEEKPIDQMSQDEAQTEIDRRLSDFSRPYWDKNHPLHKQDVDEMRLLHERGFPSSGQIHPDKIGLGQRLEKEGIKSVEDIEKREETSDDDDDLTEDEKAALDGLKNEWGEEYQANLTLAQTVVDVGVKMVDPVIGEGFIDALEESGLGNDSRVIKFLHAYGKAIEEGGQ